MSEATHVKATLTHLGSLESMTVLWNPESYRVERLQRFAAPAALGAERSALQFAAGGSERFLTRILFDTSDGDGTGARDGRDVRSYLERLERWCDADPETALPPRLLFTWAAFRFRGSIEELREEVTLFDRDGTPLRAWVDLVLRR